jgi:hypothetical protein
MADVMEKCRGNELLARSLLLRQPRALQHVLRHGHGLAQIGLRAAPLEDLRQERHDAVAVEIGAHHSAAS